MASRGGEASVRRERFGRGRTRAGARLCWIAAIGIAMLALALGGPPPAAAQASEEEEAEAVTVLEPVVVTAARARKPLSEVPASVSVVNVDNIQVGQQTIELSESMARLPGVVAGNRHNASEGTRLAIRGFGARAGFGVRGVKILVDGIPMTFADGQAQTDMIDFSSAERVEVIRGPSSSLYGNASGGVVQIFTEDGPDIPFMEVYTVGGEYGLFKTGAKTGGQSGNLNYVLNVSRLELDGHREHSRYENVILNGKFRFEISPTADLTVLMNYINYPRMDTPSSVSREMLAEGILTNPRAIEYDANSSTTQGTAGLVYRQQFREDHTLTLNFYDSYRDIRSFLPFDRAVDVDRWYVGGGLQYTYTGGFLGRPNRFTIGTDLQHQDDDRRNFDQEGGRFTDRITLHQDENVSNYAFYFRNEFSFMDKWELTIGGRYDDVRFTAEDFLITDDDPDDSGSRTMEQFSPMVGLRFSPQPWLNLYTNVATAFETPTTVELANRPSGAGGFNPGLNPMESTQYEVGVKGFWERFSYEAALFFIRVEDELIGFELADMPVRQFYRNAGRSQHNGFELGFGAEVLPGLTTSVAYTFSDFEFRDYRTEEGVFDDNTIPGIPENQVYWDLHYRHPGGLYGFLDLLYVDEMFVDDANTETNDSYTVVNLRLGVDRTFGHWRFSPFVGLNNLFDEEYNSSVVVNSRGSRYYEPAPGFNVYGGLSVAYLIF